MYKLVGDLGTVTVGPHIVLEEIGTAYEIERIEIEKDENKSEAYLARNPAGTVPLLEHGDLVLTEAAAIMQYLAERHPEAKLMPDLGSSDRAVILRWLTFAVSTLQPAGRRFFYPERFSVDPSHADGVQKQADEHQLAAWKVVQDCALSGAGPFILGDRYTLADIYLTMISTWRNEPLEIRQLFPRVDRLVGAAIERPATYKILKLHGEI